MLIGGLQKFSLLDYPEHLSAIVFTQGCNFRCQFCYNPMLVRPLNEEGKFKNISSKSKEEEVKKGYSPVREDDLFDFLNARKNKLDAVVVTGGEPTLHNDLPEFLEKIRDLEFKIKLDTNGTRPGMLKKVLAKGLVDYLAMDLKAAPGKYDLVTGIQPDLEKLRKSIILIKESGLPYEFRTTVVPELVETEDIEEMVKMIKDADLWYLQVFRSDIELVNRDFENTVAYPEKKMLEMCEKAEKYVRKCKIR